MLVKKGSTFQGRGKRASYALPDWILRLLLAVNPKPDTRLFGWIKYVFDTPTLFAVVDYSTSVSKYSVSAKGRVESYREFLSDENKKVVSEINEYITK